MTQPLDETIQRIVSRMMPNNDPVNKFPFTASAFLKRPNSSDSQSSNADDSVSTPVKKIKLETALNYVASPREVRRIRYDLVEARNTILTLENRIKQMHNVRKQVELMYDNESQQLKKQHEHDRHQIDELEQQLQTIRQRELALKQEFTELKNNYNILKLNKDVVIEELEKSLSEMKEESKVFDSEENSEIVSLNRRIAELQILLDQAEEDAERHKILLNELQANLTQKKGEERDFEKMEQALQAARLRISELENAKENFLDFQEQAKSQTEKLINYATLERDAERLRDENARIKDEIRNKLILEEEVHNLKTKIASLKTIERKFAQVQAEKLQNELYLDEWRAVARGVCESTDSDASLPHLMRKAVERLQHQEISLTSAKVELESKLSAIEFETSVAKNELSKMRKQLEDGKKLEEQRQTIFIRMQKKLRLLTSERDSYRQQLDSYEKDLTVNFSAVNTNSDNQREKIESLEKIIKNYQELNERLETDLMQATPNLTPDVKAEQLAKLQGELDRLRMENQKLSDRKDQLEIQLENFSIGNDTLKGGQVVHLAQNPLSLSREVYENQITKLQDEVVKWKKRVKKLEEGLETSKINESLIPSTKELTELKEKLKNQESQAEHFKERYRSAIQEFRNVIYLLLGYKVDRTSPGLYRLQSVYAEREGDQLYFQVNEEGSLNLLENEFSATLEEMVNLHLKHQKSIPVFLSALTMDLFNNSTIATKSSFVID